MATIAQIAANRENALSSSGPKSAEGKSRIASNAVNLGLFTMNDFVLPDESIEHQIFCEEFWRELYPAGPVEETFATEMIRAAWRLRRCGLIESALAETPEQNEANLRTQTAVDRARAQANNLFRRAHNDLRRLQAERKSNGFGFSDPPAAPQPVEPAPKTAAAIQTQSIPGDAKTERPGLIAAAIRSQPVVARQAPCPCGSREKYKRCCGRNAPRSYTKPRKKATGINPSVILKLTP